MRFTLCKDKKIVSLKLSRKWRNVLELNIKKSAANNIMCSFSQGKEADIENGRPTWLGSHIRIRIK